MVFLATLIAGVAMGFTTTTFAVPQLDGDLYISEVYSLEDKYIEIFVNKQVPPDNYYYIMTTLKNAEGIESDSTVYALDNMSEQVDGSYYFLDSNIIKSLSGLNLSNPSVGNIRTVYLCYSDVLRKPSRLECKSNAIDAFAYAHIGSGSKNSWSRDFDDDGLEIKESNRTPGKINDFVIDEGEEDTDDDNVEEPSMCSSLSLNEISFSEPDKFIEIINTTAMNINLADCTLRRGNEHINLDGEIKAGEIKSFSVTESTLVQTNNGVNIHIYDRLEKKNVVTVAYKAKTLTSYAWLNVDGVEQWYSTYNMTPGEENIYQYYPNCEAGYYLNTATNKCNKNPDPPAECAEGQYRNPETGRCRKYPEAKVLAECPEGQFRNPLTNRCKKIATTDDLMPCAEGYERNPETNRCRKIRSSDSAEYAVEPYGVSSESHTWAIIGAAGIGAIALLIALQFRYEIAQGFNRFIGRFKK